MNGRSWPGSHVVDLDLRSLAFTRFGLGVLLLVDTLIRWSDLTAHYSDYGVLPRKLLLDIGWNPHFLSIHMVSGESFWLHGLFLLQALAAGAVALGYRTRWATFTSWFLLISIHNRNPWLLNGGDVYLRVILFWMLFLPWGQIWSMDARFGRSDLRKWMSAPKDGEYSIRSFAGLAILLQVCLLYWFAALPKSHPSWVADYSAVQIALQLDHLVKPFGHTFREMFSQHLKTLTYLVFEWETWGPFLLWFPFDRGQIRTATLLGFVGLHLGFELTLELGMFPAICMTVPLLLLPAWVWEVPLRRVSLKLESHLGSAPPLKVKASPPWRIASETLYASLTIYLLSWNFGNEQFRPALWLPDSLDRLGYTLRLDQRWNMFSPSPPYQDGWWVVVGHRRDGSTLNALDPNAPLNWAKPDCIAQLYRNQRRRRWMMELRTTGDEQLLKSYAQYLSRQLNQGERSLHEVSELTFYYMLELTNSDGTEKEPEKLRIYHHRCYERPSPQGIPQP